MKLYTKNKKYYVEIDDMIHSFSQHDIRMFWVLDYLYNKMNN